MVEIPEIWKWYIGLGVFFWLFCHIWLYVEFEFEIDLEENYLLLAITSFLYGALWIFFIPFFALLWCCGKFRQWYIGISRWWAYFLGDEIGCFFIFFISGIFYFLLIVILLKS